MNQNTSINQSQTTHDVEGISSISRRTTIIKDIKSYVDDLKSYKSKISAIAKDLTKSKIFSSKDKIVSNNTPITRRKSVIKVNEKSSKTERAVSIIDPPELYDVSHIINEAFKTQIHHDLNRNTKILVDSKDVMEHLSLIEDIRRAEADVMEVEERILKADNLEGVLELRPWNVENYSLLHPEMFGDNSNVKKEISLKENDVSEKTVYGIHAKLRELRLRLNNQRPRLKITQPCMPVNIQEYPMLVENSKETNFLVKIKDNILRFKRFVPGNVYKKTIIITNTGQRTAPFKILSDGSSNKMFSYDYHPRGPLAPGMNVKFTVTFNCTSLEDVYEYITVVTKENKKTSFLIWAQNEAPVLKYSVECYDVETNCKNHVPRNSRSTSVATVFECNACLVGALKMTTVTITNTGRSAKFICVPEDIWYTKSIEDIEWNKTISFGAFKVIPSIFEIEKHQSITLNVSFEPRSPSFYCSRFIIMSDNFCAREVNVFGDGQMFDNRIAIIRLEGRGLQSNGASAAEDTGSYVLDMGKIGDVVRYVYAKNTSRIKYSFRWIINHSIDRQSSKNVKVNFNIHPSSGLLEKYSETMFRVQCSVTNEIVNEQLIGKYRVTATMMVDDIPKESINDFQHICFEEQEDNPELLSVKVVEMEVISEYKGKEHVSLSINPQVVDLSWYKLQTDMCLKNTVDFINKGSCPVNVCWIPEVDSDLATVTVYPELFEVVDRTAIQLRIQPKCSGRLREALKFRAENLDGNVAEMVVYVRGFVEKTPKIYVQPAIKSLVKICAGTQTSYTVELTVKSVGPFDVYRRLYEFNDYGNLISYGDEKSFGPYGNDFFLTTLNFKTPIGTDVAGISCQLVEWSLDSESKAVHSQAVTYVALPDVRLNVNTVAIAESLYTGVSYGCEGIRLFNNTHCDFIFSWGNPIGPDANSLDCAITPANGTVCGKSTVEFVFVVTPKKSGRFDKFLVPFFVQCDAIPPQTVTVKCRANDFGATITYVDMFDRHQIINWNNHLRQWTMNDSCEEINQMESEYLESEDNRISTKSIDVEHSRELEIEPEDLEPTEWSLLKWPRRDTLLWSPEVEQFRRIPVNHYHSVMAFKDIECNIATEQVIIIRNITKIPCRVKTKVNNYDYSMPIDAEHVTNEGENETFVSIKRCMIWIEKDDEILTGHDEVRVSVWVLATAWGQYQDTLTIELHVGSDILPAILIPIVVQAITFPIEYPLAIDVHKPTIKFSLYSINSEHQLKIMNISEIPILISWRVYNESEEKRPFGVIFDTVTPDYPNLWSFRINRFYGLESPRYFMIRPCVLKLEPKEQGTVTFFLDRTKEISIYRNENNIANGVAVGTINSLEPPGKYCTRDTGFKMKPTIVKLYSETKHSIQPNLVLRELDNIFRFSATQIYNSYSKHNIATRFFTLMNHLKYPTNISFNVDYPFVIKNLKTLRCGNRPGNTYIYVHYEDLIEIELQADMSIIAKNIRKPMMPINIMSRKNVQVGHLYALCEDSYFKPKVIASFEVHIHFPILKLSTRNINFGQVVVRETKSIDVMLSSYPGTERFFAHPIDVFTISPAKGIVSHVPTSLTITFRPKAEIQYSNKIKIMTTIPMDVIFLNVSGFGIK